LECTHFSNVMNITDIAYLRLFNQLLIGSEYKTAKEIVGRMGVMQAQDYSMAKWAIGVRLPGSTEKTIEAALDKGEILRSHLMRPTWHFVSSDDIYWMLELSAPQIKVIQKARDKVLQLNENIYRKSNFIIENALQGGEHLSREELALELETANIPTDNNKLYHFLVRAEIDGVICSGKSKNSKNTYALLEERVPRVRKITREEATSRLAQIYFTSHGPATIHDFIWWSGLSITESKRALETVKSNFISETIDNQIYWFPDTLSIPEPDKNTVFLLPSFDEYIISYRDRTASLPFEDHSKAVSNNGIFKPVIVVNGQVTGLWKRTTQNDKVTVETKLFQPVSKTIQNLIEEEVRQYEMFLNKKVELVRI
jgi:hypothetical protein